ncbi:hypothetical protein ZWY2020_052509 [Hordeum vulgare]|nr:hypothetical protein ZWY2020_052509 [Hordeum vulgare]
MPSFPADQPSRSSGRRAADRGTGPPLLSSPLRQAGQIWFFIFFGRVAGACLCSRVEVKELIIVGRSERPDSPSASVGFLAAVKASALAAQSPEAPPSLRRAAAPAQSYAVGRISRTLHRISAIRNRQGDIVGLTCRVGRVMPGSANLLQDLVKAGGSLLLIGPPGVGKTTVIRDIARMLADDYDKRVMIVNTSNEIARDGDIPHTGIGNARRLQVPIQEMQHKVLTEAVENHIPQAIVIDEIGTKLEAMAASTIAQRGIQLVASAHGVTIENLTMNPSVDMLVGGIQFKFRNGARTVHASAICIMDARKQIEREMERFKDPREKAKAETRDWLNIVVLWM